MLVISIQSQVVHGHVGNSAAVYPMQAAGLTVAAVPTALLSNHPHYPTLRGRVLEAELVADLLRGVEERGLIEAASVLVTGYLGSVENALVVADFVERAKRANPQLIYVCDPVMGDDDLGVFVAEGLVDVFRQRLVPLASIITPNRYELELLAGTPLRTEDAIRDAVRALAVRGPRDIVVTGCVLDDTPPNRVETIACSRGRLHRSGTARLPIRPCGTGDLFTALLVVELCAERDIFAASATAVDAVFDILERTQKAGSAEMKIIG